MMKKNVLLISFAILASSLGWSGTVNLLSDSSQWRMHTSEGRSKYVFQDGGLEMTTSITSAKQDGYIELDVPLLRKGVLDFDLEVPGEKSIGLFIELYNMTVFWHGYCGDWRRYFPEANSQRITGYPEEPVGHQFISLVPNAKKLHYRIVFDADQDRVEYYMDNMVDPARIDAEVQVLGRSEYRGGVLRLGSFGYSSKHATYKLSNLTLQPLEENNVQVEKNHFLVFDGISYEAYRVARILEEASIPKERIHRYILQNLSSVALPINYMKYSLLPGQNAIASAKTIVMADAPGGSNAVFPTFLARDVEKFVEGGGRLLVLGGYFTLERGEMKGSSLEKFLPVKLCGPFEGIKKVDIKKFLPKDKAYQWLEGMDFHLEYKHCLELCPDAEVLLDSVAGPVLVRGKYGQGEVLVFMAVPAGKTMDFTQYRCWSRLLKQMCAVE